MKSHRSSRIRFAGTVLTLVCAMEGECHAEVNFDGSIGKPGGITGPNFKIEHIRGQTAGGNLFHSFDKFNLSTTETATFTGPASIENILARVTGGPSSIRGTIRSSIPGANLFLLNPAGVVFGSGAKVDVSGAFRVSTADYLELSDGRRFSSSIDGDVTLLSAAPEAFGFLAGSAHAGEVKIEGTGTSVVTGVNLAGQDLSLVGRRVELKNVFLKSAGAEIGITAVGGGAARVPVRNLAADAGPDPSIQGEVAVTNSAVSVSSADGGLIHLRGGNVVIDGSATGFVQNGSQFETFSGIDADAKGLAGGGDIRIETAGNIAMRNNSRLASFSRNSLQGGTISLMAGGEVNMTKGADVVASASSTGNGGLIQIDATSLVVDGTGASRATRLSAQSNSGATGAAGSIDLQVTGLLDLKAGGSIVTNTFTSGAGGDITISAGSLNAAQGDGTRYTGVSSSTALPAVPSLSAGYGDAGNVTVNVSGLLDIRDSATIESTSASDGNGGTVRVNAGSLFIQGAERLGRPDRNEFLTGLLALTTMRGTGPLAANVIGGRGGDLHVDVAGTIHLIAGGQIDSSSFGGGHSGNVTVRAAGIIADRAGSDFFTGIGSDTEAWDDRSTADPTWGVAGGDAGSVSVTSTGAIRLLGGGNISSSTAGSGHAGNIAVIAPEIFISGSGSDEKYTPGRESGIVALSEASRTDGTKVTPAATGNAGTVTVTLSDPSGILTVRDGGKVSAESLGSGTGGSVIVEAAGGKIDVSGGGRISARSAASGDAGSVKVTADQIGISDAGLIESLNEGSGRAGGIVIQSRELVVDWSQIAVSAILNDAGRLEITATGDIRMTGGLITATAGGSGNAGDVTVTGRDILLSGAGTTEESGIIASTLVGSSGRGGNVSVTATGTLTLQQGGHLGAESRGAGAGGDVFVNAGSTRLLGGALLSSNATGGGIAGGMVLGTGDLEISDSEIGVRAALANAGELKITATGSIVMTGGLITATAGGIGTGGNIHVTANGNLTIERGGRVEAASTGSGKAGTVTLAAATTSLLDGSAFSSTATGTGAAGGIVLSTGDLTVRDSDIDVRAILADAGNLTITSTGGIQMTGGLITATAGGSGIGGNIKLTASGNLTVEGGGRVEAASTGSGKAGTVTLAAASTSLLDGSAFSSKATGTGAAGGILLTTGDLTVRDSDIDVRATLSDAGDLAITSTGGIQMTGGLITATAGGSGIGGNVKLTANGNLTVEGGGRVEAASTGSGKAGTVTLAAASTSLLDGSAFSSKATGTGAAGGIVLTTGDLTVRNSDIDVRAALADAGDLTITSTGGIHMAGGLVTAAAGGGGNAGDVIVQAREIRITGAGTTVESGIVASTLEGSSGRGGNVRISVRNRLTIQDGGQLGAESRGTGAGGDVLVSAGSTSLLNHALLSSNATGRGAAGGIQLTTGDLEIRNSEIGVRAAAADAGELKITATRGIELSGGLITATAGGVGAGGNIRISAKGDLTVDGAGRIEAASSGSGQAGTVTLTAGSIRLFGGSVISSKATGTGPAGGIVLTTGDVVVANSNIDVRAALANAGDLTIHAAGDIRMTGGLVTATAGGRGNAGDVVVSGRGIRVSGEGSAGESGIVASTLTGSSGRGGNVTVSATRSLELLQGVRISAESRGSGDAGRVTVSAVNDIMLSGGGLISAATFDEGDAGDVVVSARNVLISGNIFKKAGTPPVRSAIIASTGRGSSGDGGDVRVTANQGLLSISGGGLIGTESLGSGVGGSVAVRSSETRLINGGLISSNTSGAGKAGDITVNTGDLIIRNSQIGVSAGLADAGSIRIATSGGIRMSDGLVSASAGGSGGNINIRSGDIFVMDDSSLVAEAALNGGNIVVSQSPHLILDHSRISANAVNGDGGNIRLNTGTYFANESQVTASSEFGAQGLVRIDPLVTFSGGEESEEPDLLDPDDILQPDCANRSPDSGSSFTKAGRGGTRRLPGGYLPSFRIIE